VPSKKEKALRKMQEDYNYEQALIKYKALHPEANTDSVVDIDPLAFEKIRRMGEKWEREHKQLGRDVFIG